jgi:hypothetical protein
MYSMEHLFVPIFPRSLIDLLEYIMDSVYSLVVAKRLMSFEPKGYECRTKKEVFDGALTR